ncbi:MAG TPA: choice-of-anchor tandem repeat GloVer-containing protein, partial [Bacteroidia bacterium]|nr:choice-of-anchor tandem repeat GloVer-containing protein [Bacteroidia bacterium]
MKKLHFIWIVLVCSVISPIAAQFDVIHNFKKSNGTEPTGSLVYYNGLFYGLAQYGGIYNLGCIFSVRPDGTCYVDEFDFNGENGAIPQRSLTLSGGLLYGMTNSGGVNIY